MKPQGPKWVPEKILSMPKGFASFLTGFASFCAKPGDGVGTIGKYNPEYVAGRLGSWASAFMTLAYWVG